MQSTKVGAALFVALLQAAAQDSEGIRLTGRVLDVSSGMPLPDAKVHLYAPAQFRSTPSPNTMTGENGEFAFVGLEPREYRLFASKPEYRQVPGSEI